MPFDLGMPELIVILAILVLLFGAKKLPELAKSVGQSAKELRDAMKDEPSKDEKQTQNS